jgi:hypothetical protein
MKVKGISWEHGKAVEFNKRTLRLEVDFNNYEGIKLIIWQHNQGGTRSEDEDDISNYTIEIVKDGEDGGILMTPYGATYGLKTDSQEYKNAMKTLELLKAERYEQMYDERIREKLGDEECDKIWKEVRESK